jgi:hypothetical protein
MLWEFGELGYDQSINRCDDGSISSNCRVTAKPAKWEYLQDPARLSLFNHTADLIKLKQTYSVFSDGTATFEGANDLLKQMTLKNEPYISSPASADEMNVEVAVNFDVTSQSLLVSFPHTGSWYDYYGNGEEINVTATPFVVALKPGQYKLFTDFPIDHPIVTGVDAEQKINLVLYPNPVHTILQINSKEGAVEKLTIRNMQGAAITPQRISDTQWDVKELPSALYIAEVKLRNKTYRVKVVKD